MEKRKETSEEKGLAERMRVAMEKEHAYKVPEPKIVSAFRKETLRV